MDWRHCAASRRGPGACSSRSATRVLRCCRSTRRRPSAVVATSSTPGSSGRSRPVRTRASSGAWPVRGRAPRAQAPHRPPAPRRLTRQHRSSPSWAGRSLGCGRLVVCPPPTTAAASRTGRPARPALVLDAHQPASVLARPPAGRHLFTSAAGARSQDDGSVPPVPQPRLDDRRPATVTGAPRDAPPISLVTSVDTIWVPRPVPAPGRAAGPRRRRRPRRAGRRRRGRRRSPPCPTRGRRSRARRGFVLGQDERARSRPRRARSRTIP